MNSDKIQIVLKKGLIGLTDIQKDNLRGLGLRHRHQMVVRIDTPSVRGMIKKVIHLLEVGRPTAIKSQPKKKYVEILAADPAVTPAKKKAAAKAPVKKAATKKKEK